MGKSREYWNQTYNRVRHSEGEKDFGPSIVELGESVPTRVLVERFMNGGVAHSVANAMQRFYEFGFDEVVPDAFIGPRGRLANDIVDVGLLKKWVEAKIRGNEEAQAAAAAEAAAKKEAAAAEAAAGEEGKEE